MQLCRFLGVSAEYIGVTIVGTKSAESYAAHDHLFEVKPLGKRKGLSAVELPSQMLFGCDQTGVQLFGAADRAAIEGECYPYHIIHSWSRYELTVSKGRFCRPTVSLRSSVCSVGERSCALC